MRIGWNNLVFLDRRMVYRRQRSDGLGFRDRNARARTKKSLLLVARQVRSGQFDSAASRPLQSTVGFSDYLFLQRRANVDRLPRFVRQTQLSKLRSRPGG